MVMILLRKVLILWEEGRNLSWDTFSKRCRGIRHRSYFPFFLRRKESKSAPLVAFLTFLHW